jgi:putative YhdH/YhfP family quinone oxidoreductase
METYQAVVARERNGKITPAIETLRMDFLPPHEVLIRVEFAALNYKDALSAHGHTGITRQFPHTPGVDAAGTVVRDASGQFSAGDRVLCTSFDLGMNTPGGFAEFISVPASWVIPIPSTLSTKMAMVYGTAAYTAALALHKMEMCGQNPSMGPVMITGATGGVGSMAIGLLHHAGYEVHASSGKPSAAEYLKSLGATHIVGREEVDDNSQRPLLKSKWAGAIDNIGGNVLTTLLKACGRNGSVASIGLVKSPEFTSTVYPFILNGVNLLGVDSAETPLPLRHLLWEKLADQWRFTIPDEAHKVVDLAQIPDFMAKMLHGETSGRILARVS